MQISYSIPNVVSETEVIPFQRGRDPTSAQHRITFCRLIDAATLDNTLNDLISEMICISLFNDIPNADSPGELDVKLCSWSEFQIVFFI